MSEHDIQISRTPVDGTVVIEITEDKLNAYLYITEEREGGRPVAIQDVTDEIAKMSIENADLDKAQQLIDNKRYEKKIYLAKGYLPVHGEQGEVTYFFEANNDLAPKKDKAGDVDYKDLGLVRNITKGTVIANIKHPTDGMPGMTVQGGEIPAVPGKEAKYAVGTGTVINETETVITADVDGNLVWDKTCFKVEETLVVKENVDVSTGNIDFIGNVLIKGNVSENFMVKSAKDMTINGSATNATIICDGNLTIGLGSVNSSVISQGDVKLGFCESSKVECKGNFTCKSVIAGEIFCGGAFTATQDRGVVFGGKHTALGGFTANNIGTESYTKTQITLGNSAVLTEERLELANKIKDLEERTKKLLQVAEVLQEHKKNAGPLSPDREAMLTTAIRSRFTFQREIKQLGIRIKDIDDELQFVSEQFVIVHKNLWPGVTVRIGTELMIVDRHVQKVMIGKDSTGHLSYLPYTTAKS